MNSNKYASFLIVAGITGFALVQTSRGAVLPDESYNADSLSTAATPTPINDLPNLISPGTNDLVSVPGFVDLPSAIGPATAAGTDTASIGPGSPHPTPAYDSTFNGHNFVFNYQEGLVTNSVLFSGTGSRTVVVVYANTPSSALSNGASSAGQVNALAGETNGGGAGQWFELQSRNSPAGDPYLAGFAADVSQGNTVATGQLTYAVATYDGTTETLYQAYGNGAVTSESNTVALNTAASGFQEGFDSGNESGISEIGAIQVYNNTALDLADATAVIQGLQAYYAIPAPEPASLSLLGLGGFGLLARRRRA